MLMPAALRHVAGTELQEEVVLGSAGVKGKEPVIYALDKGIF